MFFTPVYLAAATSFHFQSVVHDHQHDDKHETNRPTRKFFERFLHRKRSSIVNNDTPLGNSKIFTLPRGKPDGLSYASQLSIMANQGSVEDREICVCRLEDRAVIRKMKKTAEFHLSEGNLKTAVHTLTKCLELQQKLIGKESTAAADTLLKMGSIMANMGANYQYRAMTALEEALKIYQQEYGTSSKESAECLKNIYLLVHKHRVDIISDDDKTSMMCFDDPEKCQDAY